MESDIAFDFGNIRADAVGPEHGVSENELAELSEPLARGHERLANLRQSGEVAFFDLPYDEENVARVKQVANEAAGQFGAVVVLGIGGSALGTIALRSALCHPLYNELPPARRNGPRLYIEDNVDPVRLKAVFDLIEPAKTLFVVISKSGTTVETLAQFLFIRSLLDGDLRDNVIVVTDAGPSTLRGIGESECRATLEVPAGVGGRFSVLSPVGLLPAALAGIDIDALLAGAAQADQVRCSSPSAVDNDAYMAAAVEYILYQKAKRISVMMPYATGLVEITDWYRQLWAESLGKTSDVGPTPVRATGVTDQHSQVQLYREGPNDKVICFLAVQHFQDEVPIPPAWESTEAIGYIGGHSFNQLIEYERIATTLALTDAQRPNYTITLPEVNPYSVGQLLYMLEVKAAISGELYGVNAFDQPGVEAGKALSYGLMGRKHYERARQWVMNKQAGRSESSVDEMVDEMK